MLPRLLVLLAITIWGWTFVATKIALDYLSPTEILGIRFALGAPMLYLILRARGLRLSFARAERRSVALGALIIGAHLWLQAFALQYTSATNTGWIIGVCPLALAALAFFILKERIGRKTALGMALASAGILLLISKGELSKLDWLGSIGDWLILLSAFTWGLFTITTRDISRSHNPLAVALAVILPATAATIVYMLFTSDWRMIAQLPTAPLAALVFLGVLGTALANWFWQVCVARLGAVKTGMFLYLEPLATTALAVPYLGEQFGWHTALGGTLVIFGVYVSEMKRKRREPGTNHRRRVWGV
ncbi:MAG: DMT family transporter [Candidatus Zixiibacteriota bacterium]